MLSAYAALREKQPVLTGRIADAEPETDSEAEVLLSATEACTKRKQSPKTITLPSRKRRKANQETRYFSEKAVEPVDEVHHVSARGYSPSDPTSRFSRDVEMRESNPSRPIEPLSSFFPSLGRNVFFDHANDDSTKLYLALKPSDTLSFVGTVAITVLQGSISLFGSIIPASPIRHQVYAPKNYPLATIQSMEYSGRSGGNLTIPDFMEGLVTQFDAVLEIKDLRSGVQGLHQVCPIHLANFEAPVETSFDFKLREFVPLLHAGSSYVPFYIPPSWSSALADIDAQEEECMTAFVKGPKGSGKSMFTRMLVNRLLLRHKHVAYLDCDTGQTEFTPPGMVSLHIITEPIYGPPFTHPHQPFRAHFVGSSTIRSSPRHYQECILALLDVYRLDVKHNYELNGQGSTDEASEVGDIKGIPLLINSYGWNKGLGAESIHLIESQIDLTHVYTFESHRPEITTATGNVEESHTINYFPLEKIKLAKPDQGQADRRSLMIMSYFHHHKQTNKTIHWNTDLPLCAQPPWEATWVDAIDRIILIGSGSEDVVASELLRVLNGAIVALVALDSGATGSLKAKDTTTTVPYTQGASPPRPNCSNCVGLALVRGVQASSGSLHILTPVPPELLAQARVLVMGEVKLPIWGMLDYRTDAKTTDQIVGVKLGAVPFLQWSSAPDGAPGSKTLRVRRNLMRKNQSFSHP